MGDRIVCTPDSVNLVSEACADAAPVFVWSADIATGRLRAFLDALRSRGRVRDLDDALAPFAVDPLRETARVASEVRRRLALPDRPDASNCNPLRAHRIADRLARQCDAFVEGHSARTPIQVQRRPASSSVACATCRAARGVGIEQSGIVQRIEDRRRRTWRAQSARAFGCRAAPGTAAGIPGRPARPVALLEVEARRVAAVQLGAHAPPHRRPRRRAPSSGDCGKASTCARNRSKASIKATSSPATQRARTSAWCSQVHARSPLVVVEKLASARNQHGLCCHLGAGGHRSS
jgi:hypothetical protein